MSEEKIHKIRTQTSYTDDEIKNKLIEHNDDEIRVIREYLNLPLTQISKPVVSVNQEIFRQIRHTLDDSMRKHRESNPIDVKLAATNMLSDVDNKNDTPFYATI